MTKLQGYLPPVAAQAISARSAMRAAVARRREFGGYLTTPDMAARTSTNKDPAGRVPPDDNTQTQGKPAAQRPGPYIRTPAKPNPPSGPAHNSQLQKPAIAEATAEYVWWPSHTASDRQLVRVGVPFRRKCETIVVYRERKEGALRSKAL